MITRDLLFRGWNKNTKKMIDLHLVTPLAVAGNVDEKTDGVYLPFIENIIIQQYTGFKDVNGKYIYEGDIVIEKTERNTFVYLVVWLDDRFVFQSPSKNINVGIATQYTEVAIIGNIFENPDLYE